MRSSPSGCTASAVVEPARRLTGTELQQRLCAYYQTPLLAPFAQELA